MGALRRRGRVTPRRRASLAAGLAALAVLAAPVASARPGSAGPAASGPAAPAGSGSASSAASGPPGVARSGAAAPGLVAGAAAGGPAGVARSGAAAPGLVAGAAAGGPALRAPAAIVVERDLGVTVLGRNADEERSIASTTKLMTAYVALHRAGVGRVLAVQPYAPAPGETVAGLRPGELLSVGDLLAAMLLPSGGDAAHSLAVDLAGSTDRFVGWMNAAAATLHMGSTHYSTPVGLDTPGNYSTARDLATLAGALLANPDFARIVSRSRIVLADGRTMVNRNDLVGRYPFVIGVKTGSTADAGYCLVGAGRRDGATVISVVLGEPTEAARDADTLRLLRYGLSLYHGVEAVHRGRVYARVPVDGRPLEQLSLVAARSVTLVVRRGARLALFTRALAASARGPLPSHTPLGRLDVELGGRLVARVPLVSRGPLVAPPAPAAAAPHTARRRIGWV